MINELALKDALLALSEQCKYQYLSISAVADEVAALRESVRGLDPTFSDVLEQHRKTQSSDEIRSAAIALFDRLIEIVKSDKIC